MDSKNSAHVQAFEHSLEAWTDSRFLTREQVRVLAMFTMYLVNLADDNGWQFDGYSWKESSYLGCLVVKATVDGVPSVVFTNAATAVAGMGIFLRKLDADLLEWVPDKYRG